MLRHEAGARDWHTMCRQSHICNLRWRCCTISYKKPWSCIFSPESIPHGPMPANGFAIATLVLFVLSTIFVIQPFSFHVPLPIMGRTRINIRLITAPIIAVLILWTAQCISATQIRDRIVGTGPFPPILSRCLFETDQLSNAHCPDGIKSYSILILFISLAYMAITLDITGILQAAAFWVSKRGNIGRKLYSYFNAMYIIVAIIIYSVMPSLENRRRYLVTMFRHFTSGFSSQGHRSRKDRTSFGNPRPDDIVDVGGAWKDINWFKENISLAVQVVNPQIRVKPDVLTHYNSSERSQRLALFKPHCRTLGFIMGSIYQHALSRFAVYSEVD